MRKRKQQHPGGLYKCSESRMAPTAVLLLAVLAALGTGGGAEGSTGALSSAGGADCKTCKSHHRRTAARGC